MPPYQTYRRVDIYQPGISRAYYALTVVIILFIPVYLVQTHGQLRMEAPTGVLFARSTDPKNFTSLPCPETVLRAGGKCTAWDWLEMVDTNPEFIFATTFVRDRIEERMCDRKTVPCGAPKLWSLVNVSEYYIAGSEELLLGLEHRAFTSDGRVFESRMLSGFLSSGGDCGTQHDLGDVRRSFGLGKDKLPVREFLEAVNISLDRENGCAGCRPAADGLGHTLRRWGAHLDLTIHYSNLWPQADYTWVPGLRGFNPGETQYQYCVRHVPSVDGVRLIFSADSTPFITYNGSREYRVVRRVYGVKIHVHVTGVIGTFSWASTLSFVIGAVTLLTLPWTLTELYLSLLPMIRSPIPQWYHDFVAETGKVKTS